MSRLARTLERHWMLVLVSVLTTAVVVLIGVNLFATGEKQIDEAIPRLYALEDPQFMRVMGVMLGPPIVGGNRYQELRNGDEIFPAMLQAIRGARHSIDFETYIYWSGDIGKTFADALADRARAGVKVQVLLDWLGSQKISPALINEMREAGVQVERYHALEWYNLGRVNNRTHRKILVVDGRIGFTGGVGIAPEWTGNAQDADHWRDTHFRLEGPAVAQMQAVFLDNWVKTTGEVMHGTDYFPALDSVGDGRAQVFMSSPQGGAESMHLMYLLAITAAQRSIYLSMAYFVPDELALNALRDALKRGVKVQIVTPGPIIDTETVRKAGRALWGDLLQAGAEFYEYQPTMYHCKVMIVDEFLTSVGSTNFDNRSFRLNDEANLNIYDHAFAQRQIEVFRADVARSRRITYEAWQNRSWKEKALEKLSSVLRVQL
ncbi:MAG TPA: cardiolipin synthase [Casimicrobiaceae bacterium]|nr:cardiolipin synthase [Casimicrobiaceae bacterium]